MARTLVLASTRRRISKRSAFTRIGEGELLYQFHVDDPVHYTKPWSGEYSFKPAQGGLFEYACHEGNYSVPGILRGARLKEMAAAKAAHARP